MGNRYCKTKETIDKTVNIMKKKGFKLTQFMNYGEELSP